MGNPNGSSPYDDNVPNFMEEDYNDTETNCFDGGLTPLDCDKSENRKILLRNVPFKLKLETIRRLLEQFGTVVSVDIPKNQDSFNNKSGFRCVFAEFQYFNEAERAIRGFNFEKNSGFDIRAFFAHAKLTTEARSNVPSVPVAWEIESGWDTPKIKPSEGIATGSKDNDCKTGKQKEQDSEEAIVEQEKGVTYKGHYDPKKKIFTFNEDVLKNVQKFKRREFSYNAKLMLE